MEPPPLGTRTRAGTVLVVEDDPNDLQILTAQLAEYGPSIHLETATTLAAALEAIDRFVPIAIYLDLNLPDCSGLVTLTRVRAKHPLLPIIVITGIDDEDIASRALRRGADDYLVKGTTTPGLLVRVLNHAITRRDVAMLRRRLEDQAMTYAGAHRRRTRARLGVEQDGEPLATRAPEAFTSCCQAFAEAVHATQDPSDADARRADAIDRLVALMHDNAAGALDVIDVFDETVTPGELTMDMSLLSAIATEVLLEALVRMAEGNPGPAKAS